MEESIVNFSDEILSSLKSNWEQLLSNLPKIVLALFVFSLTVFLAGRVSRFFGYRLSRKAHDQLFTSFIIQVSKYALIIIGLMISLQILDLSGLAGGLLAGAGVSALIIGFAFKDIGENFLSGIILAFDRPFNMDDTIVIDSFMGNVKALNFRTTHIKTFDEKDVYIPNSIMVKQPLTNLTRDGKLRIDFLIGIAYEDDVREAIKVILDTVKQCKSTLQEPAPFSVVEDFSPSTVNLRIYFWTDTDDYRRGVLLTKSDIMGDVKRDLLSRGFTLPAEIQELKVYDKKDGLPIMLKNAGPPRDRLLPDDTGKNSAEV